MASKLNFRARTLDASKPMAIYNIEDLPELTDLNAINRSVPAMPSGMEKEEESEKHLQDILDAQSSQKIDETAAKTLVIPTPEVFSNAQILYKKGYKVPRQYIHVQPFSMDAEKPDYDVDENDEKFVTEVLIKEKKFDKIDLVKFEEMIDQLEKNCTGHNVISAQDAKLNLKGDDDLIFAGNDMICLSVLSMISILFSIFIDVCLHSSLLFFANAQTDLAETFSTVLIHIEYS